MSEWWTYRPSDFLMFSARSYARMVESYNREIWPAHLPMMALGICLIWVAWRPIEAARGRRAWGMGLALAWMWVAWAFHWQRFAQINLAAEYFAWASALQAVLLATLVLPGGADERTAGAANASARRTGASVCAAAILFYPLAAPLMGQSWAQAEVFGIMPQPTALATIGVLLATGLRHRLLLAVIPVTALLVGTATSWLLAAK